MTSGDTPTNTAVPNNFGRPKTGYFPALDGLRAVAVLVVMLSHAGVAGFSGGKVGVLLFFALSGFLITGILLNEAERTGTISYRNFYARRFLRLLPAALLVIAATTALALVVGGESAEKSLAALPAVLLYVNNWLQVAGIGTGWFSHFWSLAIEEQFYLVWPLLLLLVFRWRGRRAVAAVALTGAVASIVLKMFHGGDPGRHAGTDFAADALLLGCALAAGVTLWDSQVKRWASRGFWPAVLGLVLATAIGVSSGDSSQAEYELFGRLWWPLAAVTSTIVIAALVTKTAPRWVDKSLSVGPVVYLGRISYGMYLWHIILLGLINSDFSPVEGVAARFVTLFVATVIVAFVSFRFVETPFLARKKKFESRVEATVPSAR